MRPVAEIRADIAKQRKIQKEIGDYIVINQFRQNCDHERRLSAAAGEKAALLMEELVSSAREWTDLETDEERDAYLLMAKLRPPALDYLRRRLSMAGDHQALSAANRELTRDRNSWRQKYLGLQAETNFTNRKTDQEKGSADT